MPLIGIVDAKAWWIVANYKESYIRGFAVGDTAWVSLDSSPWHLRRAKIAGIARGVSREPVPNRLLNQVAPTTDWIRLRRRFPVTLTLVGAGSEALHGRRRACWCCRERPCRGIHLSPARSCRRAAPGNR